MVRRLKRFVYETVIPAPGSSRIWSQLQVREPGAANLELAGSSYLFDGLVKIAMLNSQNFAIVSQKRFDLSICLLCMFRAKLTNQMAWTKTQKSQFHLNTAYLTCRLTNQWLAQSPRTDRSLYAGV